jgi:glycosyltransferase involved in cell wall biosynthesis
MNAISNLNVIHVASGDLWGGAEAQLLTLVRQLQAHSYVEVTVVLLNHGQLEARLVEHNIPTIVFDEQQMSFLSILASLTKLFNDKRPQVIHSHRQKENILSSLANFLTVRVKCVRTQHGAPEFQYSWRQIHKKIQHRLDNFCGRFLQSNVIAVSAELADKLKGSFPSTHIVVIENGVDLDLLKSSQAVAPFKQTWSTTRHIGIVGRLVPVKRLDLFLAMVQAFIATEAQEGDVQFHIVGDGPLRAELEQQAEALALSKHVTFHGHIANIADYIRSLDVLIMCSDHEGLPMTLLEAMALGTPIVSYNAGALTPYFLKECGGVLSRAHNSEAYSEGLKKLLANNVKRDAIILDGQKVVSEIFSANINAEKILNVYQA